MIAKKTLNNLTSLFKDDSVDNDVLLEVKLTVEQKDLYKNGLLKLDADKDGNIYAQLRENGRYGKKLNVEETSNQVQLMTALQLEVVKNVLIELVDTLENVEETVSEILSGLHNDRVGLYYSGIALYLESLQVTDEEFKKQLIAQALKSLNDAQAQIVQEFKSDIAYLKLSEFKNIKNSLMH